LDWQQCLYVVVPLRNQAKIIQDATDNDWVETTAQARQAMLNGFARLHVRLDEGRPHPPDVPFDDAILSAVFTGFVQSFEPLVRRMVDDPSGRWVVNRTSIDTARETCRSLWEGSGRLVGLLQSRLGMDPPAAKTESRCDVAESSPSLPPEKIEQAARDVAEVLADCPGQVMNLHLLVERLRKRGHVRMDVEQSIKSHEVANRIEIRTGQAAAEQLNADGTTTPFGRPIEFVNVHATPALWEWRNEQRRTGTPEPVASKIVGNESSWWKNFVVDVRRLLQRPDALEHFRKRFREWQENETRNKEAQKAYKYVNDSSAPEEDRHRLLGSLDGGPLSVEQSYFVVVVVYDTFMDPERPSDKLGPQLAQDGFHAGYAVYEWQMSSDPPTETDGVLVNEALDKVKRDLTETLDPVAQADNPPPIYVTFADVVATSNEFIPIKSLYNWKSAGKLPAPLREGKGTRPAVWDWNVLRPVVEQLADLPLPKCPVRNQATD
jgi:hypothetical protein